MKNFIIRKSGWILLSTVLILGGCGKAGDRSEKDEAYNPHIAKARALANQGDCAGALKILNQVLDKKPGLALAHLHAAQLYDQFEKNYVRAIYHYQRYLELVPDTDKRKLIEEHVKKASLAFVAAQTGQPLAPMGVARTPQPPQPVSQQTVPAQPASTPLQAAPGAVPTAPDQPKKYQVQAGDNFSKIAAKVYQNPNKWKIIHEANRETVPDPKKLRAGQILIIPPLTNPATLSQETP